MSQHEDPEFLEKIRQQFDRCPYPKTPVEVSHQDNPDFLYIHNLITPYYLRNQKVINTEGKLILDAGCGTGFKALGLVEANPGAKVVGVDISPESIDFAKKRLLYHGYEAQTDFQVLALEDLPQLGMQFDYINCDEVLYLLSQPVEGLKAMQAVLKPDGIIRVNLHSLYGRGYMLRAQQVFRLMGLMEQNPGELEIETVRETMDAFKDHVILKRFAWRLDDKESESILANHLLVGDKGFTIQEMFGFLEEAGLEFIKMVDWRKWQLLDLFKDPDNLPVFWGLGLEEASIEAQLALFEIIHPINRLLDLWCGNPQPETQSKPIAEWSDREWESAIVHLHPQLKRAEFQATLKETIARFHPFEVSQFLPNMGASSLVDSSIATCLFLPLLEAPQSLRTLSDRWQKFHPLDPLTGESISSAEAFHLIQQAVMGLEASSYLLVESQGTSPS